MSQMNHLLKINMIYICPRGLLHDVIAVLTSHFIVVVVSDVLQIFARCVENLWAFWLKDDKGTEVGKKEMHINRSNT